MKNYQHKKDKHFRVIQSVLLLLLVLLLLQCMVVSGRTKLLKGTGSTFSLPINRKLSLDFSLNPLHTNFLEYSASNSVEGFTMMIDEDDSDTDSDVYVMASVDFSPNVTTTAPYMCLPNFAEALVFVVNLANLSQLNLSPEVIVRIYEGNITMWNDPAIVSLNSGVTLPNERIVPLFRTGYSGTTYVLTRWFRSVKPSWPSVSALYNFNIDSSYMINSNSDMMQYVSSSHLVLLVCDLTIDCCMVKTAVVKNSIGYTSLSVCVTSEYLRAVGLVHVRNPSGNFIRPSTAATRSAVKSSLSATNHSMYDTKSVIPSPYLLSLFNSKASDAYPAVTYCYWCLYTHFSATSTGRALYLFLRDSYALMETPTYLNMSVVNLPAPLSKFVANFYSSKLTCGRSRSLCKNEIVDLGSRVYLPLVITLGLVALIGAVLIIAGSAYFCFLRVRGHIPPVAEQISMKKMKKVKKKKVNMDDKYRESLIDHDILKEINGEFRTTLNVEDFTLDEQIGSGSFSEVYRGRWMGAPVAIKRFLLIDVDVQREVLDDFLKETTLMSSLHHPNIVKFYGAAKKHPHLYILTEFCERGSLFSILKNKNIALSNRKILKMAIDTARGMAYLHSSNPPVIHRDLKSANLLCDKNWNVKVADFGLSRVVDQSRQMTLCGTAETCAPEVLSKSGSYTEKADVYSFGIVLWEMFSRKPLYPDLNFFELSQRVVHDDFRPHVNELPEKTPASVVELMQQCWQRKPEKRPTFDQVREVLEAALKDYEGKRNESRGKPSKKRGEDDL